MLQLAVILPTYNESKNIASMVERLDKALAGIAWEAIFVDDNSPDGTADVARAIGRSDPRIRVIERIGRRGLASAAIEGMCATAAPIVAVMDSDHQHDPALLPPMLAAITSGNATWPMPRALPKGPAPKPGAGPTGSRPRAGQCHRPQGHGRAVVRPDERVLHAARHRAARRCASPVGRGLQDPARHSRHG
jgi:glycosyltransferase involved in cell wall biosynthesis